ncbi:MAG: bifunctional (p)ppGpp synthetase/guanosine-3',5'-bis(diphosphate) 3'-pyrophosphohydrolase [Alloprevotella sp.]|nr:bifunctional (p)ppGpp synthetase/guanosine-3',5'-bis(diphosphate) 3'-pyrophosphohydrolase [Alloprevotella sp.]
MPSKVFTPSEKQAFSCDLLAVMRALGDGLSAFEVRAVSSYLREELGQGASLRDEFGLNKVLTALQTARLAISEIGLRGPVLTACLVRATISSDEQIGPVERRFGKGVAESLRAFLRVERLLETETSTMASDDFRNLIVSQCGDMRVVLLLIADCVCRMRQVKDVPQDAERRRLSAEAAHVFAPLAHKLGLYTLKSELEDLSLKYLEHDAYYHIKEKLNATKAARDAYIARFIAPLRERLDAEGLRYHIKGRTKSIHSIWQKMKKQRCGFEGVYDLFAIRIIIDAPLPQEKALCWRAFSVVTYEYESNLRRLRDWLTVPKGNGYESLHITVRGPEDKWVEVQIRTERMDEIAEHGLAAHWRYKGVKASGGGVDAWLAGIRSALEQGNEAALSESLGAGVKDSEVYVFSPKGDLYKLPAGATVLDFAYLIHTGLGNKCVGGRVAGKNVPIRYRLESGQRVEILTSSGQTPKAEWLNIVVSPRAKAKIRAAVNDLQAAEGRMAREILERKLKNKKLEWDESAWNQLVKHLGYKETNDFYRAVVSGRADVNAVLEQYAQALEREARPAERVPQHRADEFSLDRGGDGHGHESSDVLVIDKNLKGLDFQMARCCSPVYGDDVFGFVTSQGGIKIHRNTCPNAPALRTRFPYRVVRARWAGKGAGKYAITLRVVGNDDLGIVNNITSIISKEERIMLRSISIDSNDGLFSGVLTVLVDDTQVLTTLIKKLRTVKGVKAVSRS